MEHDERNGTLEITANELWILSYYRESELAGALVMGRLARETDDDDLRVHLTEHCAEEATHAWLWTETILAVGGTPLRVAETYQSRYYAEIGQPATVLEVLALTQVFERRVLRHFRSHLRRPHTHPVVAGTLERMIADEAGHIGWVKRRLDRYARERGEAGVAETLRRFAEVDRKVYAGLLEYRDTFARLVDPARRNGGGHDDDVERRVRQIVCRSLGRREEDLDGCSSLQDLGVASLDLVVVVSALEDAFRVELSPEDTENLRTLGDMTDKIAELANLRLPASNIAPRDQSAPAASGSRLDEGP